MISAVIMFSFGAGPVKGFAWTLSIGVLTSVFSAILVTQLLIGWWFRVTRAKTLPIAKDASHERNPDRQRAARAPQLWPFIHFVPRQTHFNFVGLAPYAAMLSVLLVIGSVASLVLHGAAGELRRRLRRRHQDGDRRRRGRRRSARSAARWRAMGADDAAGAGRRRRTARRCQFSGVAGQTPDAAPAFVQAKLQASIPGLKVTGVSEVGAKVSGELI